MVRCISMDTTEGLSRGIECHDTGKPIQAPVGPECLGRIINVIGEPVDEAGPIGAKSFIIFIKSHLLLKINRLS